MPEMLHDFEARRVALRSFAALLDPSRLRQEGWFEPEPILRKWREHTSGHRNWDSHLWGVLMMQAWLDRYRGNKDQGGSVGSL